jgi:hypothetical protein
LYIHNSEKGKEMKLKPDPMTPLYVAMIIAGTVLLAMTLWGCTKTIEVEVPKIVPQEVVKIERIEVPTPVLQRCIAPPVPELPAVAPYKCKKGHLCFDPKNRAGLETVFGILVSRLAWLENHCTEQTKEEIIQGTQTEGMIEEGSML